MRRGFDTDENRTARDESVVRPTPASDRGEGFAEVDLETALLMAIRAPSIHNSQPWRWRVRPHGVELYTDATRRLTRTDPAGRDQVISCGAALHHLLVGLADAGQGARVRRLPEPSRPFHLATVEPAPRIDADIDAALAALIGRRHTDRRPFRSWPVPPELTGEMAELADRQGVGLDIITDARARRRLYRAIEVAARQQDADPAYAAELAAWSGRTAGAREGVPADRAPSTGPVPGRMPMRGFAGDPPPLATQGEPESAALLLVSTSADTPLQWLRVGEVTSAILLTATRHGLAGSPLTQPLEVGDTRTFIRNHVSCARSSHPQILLRIGWPRLESGHLRPTPRRPLAEVVDR
jgi:hypothetical protein